MNVKGDLTLDREMTFRVYTRRHGHTDTYRVKRTVEGWEVKHISINGKCDKDGTGALLHNLHHDRRWSEVCTCRIMESGRRG